MTLRQLFKSILPYVKPYKWLIAAALGLTLIGSLAAQVNAYVLQYTVNSIASLLEQQKPLVDGLYIIAIITAILLGKEVLSIIVTFGQKSFAEKIKIYISRDLAQQVIERMTRSGEELVVRVDEF